MTLCERCRGLKPIDFCRECSAAYMSEWDGGSPRPRSPPEPVEEKKPSSKARIFVAVFTVAVLALTGGGIVPALVAMAFAWLLVAIYRAIVGAVSPPPRPVPPAAPEFDPTHAERERARRARAEPAGTQEQPRARPQPVNPADAVRVEAQALLGWDGQKLTQEQYKLLRRSAMNLWHPDKRQAYVATTGKPAEAFDAISTRVLAALTYLETNELVATGNVVGW